MKKILFLVISVLFLVPIGVFAKTYNITDLTIDIDDSSWYIFTKDNIKDNEELDELGITYEYMNNAFNTEKMDLDALAIIDDDDYIEMLIFVKSVNVKSNLHKYSDSDIKDLENELVKDMNSKNHGIYSVNGYKFVYFEYTDGNTYLIDYYTVINGKGYTIKFQKPKAFEDFDKDIAKSLVDTVSFKLDSKYEKEPSKFNYTRIIVYAVIGGLAGGITSLVKSKSKKKDKIEQ